MAVFSIPQGLALFQRHGIILGQLGVKGGSAIFSHNGIQAIEHKAAYSCVIGTSQVKHLSCKATVQNQILVARTNFCHGIGIVGGVSKHQHILPVLGGGTKHGRSTNVDELHGFFKGKSSLHLVKERIEVDAHQVNGSNTQLIQGIHVGSLISNSKNSCMNLGMQGLYSTIKALWKLSNRTYIGNRYTLLYQVFGSSAGGKNLPVIVVEKIGQLQNTIFYEHTDKGTSTHIKPLKTALFVNSIQYFHTKAKGLRFLQNENFICPLKNNTEKSKHLPARKLDSRF